MTIASTSNINNNIRLLQQRDFWQQENDITNYHHIRKSSCKHDAEAIRYLTDRKKKRLLEPSLLVTLLYLVLSLYHYCSLSDAYAYRHSLLQTKRSVSKSLQLVVNCRIHHHLCTKSQGCKNDVMIPNEQTKDKKHYVSNRKLSSHDSTGKQLQYRLLSFTSSTTLFMSSSPSSSQGNDSKKPNRNPIDHYKKQLTIMLSTMKTKYKNIIAMTTLRRTIVQFQSLSKRSQRLIMIQLFCCFFLFGTAVKNIYQNNGPPPPIEVPYSTFLDIIEQQKYWKDYHLQQRSQQNIVEEAVIGNSNDRPKIIANSYLTNTKYGNVPIMSHIRIGSDRYMYRLYPNPHSAMPTTTSKAKMNDADFATNQDVTTETRSFSNIAAAKGKYDPSGVTQSNNDDATSKSKSNAAAIVLPTGTSAGFSSISSSSSFSPSSIVSQINNKMNIKYNKNPSSLLSSMPSSSSALFPPSSSLSPKQKRQLQRILQSPYIAAYTRPIPVSFASSELINVLRQNDISFMALPTSKSSPISVTIRSVVAIFYFVILFRLYKTMSGASGSSKGDTPGKLASSDVTATANFDDIQGIDDAKYEVMELVNTLRHPENYLLLGARPPTGLLLEGSPGTGKTMLARATAAAAGIPLIYCSGSDFVEMYVGRGAARVRRLFDRAEKLAPCIIFIDELDALGKSRDQGNNMFGGSFSRSNDEAEQTLNQLLTCMDGLDSTRRICVLAATNRKEVLDPALVRPGRFDRIVKLKLPNSQGREAILRVHTKKLPGFTECTGVDPKRPNALGMGRSVDLSAVAAVTEGCSGAELEYIVNEAAIRAVRRVSTALQNNVPHSDIIPHVNAIDFEESIKSFYETRKPKGGNTNNSNIFKNAWMSNNT